MQTSQAKLPISVFVVCFNEESNIRRLLDSCVDMDEIIIVDSGSTDNTIQIAKEYTDQITFNEWPGYAKQKAFAMSLCKNEWVLNLDADEELLPALVKRFAEVIGVAAANVGAEIDFVYGLRIFHMSYSQGYHFANKPGVIAGARMGALLGKFLRGKLSCPRGATDRHVVKTGDCTQLILHQVQ